MYKFNQYLRHLNRIPEILVAAHRFEHFFPLTLDYLDAKPLTFPVEARLQHGLCVQLIEREEIKILWHIFVRECYQVVSCDKVILDLGANVGFFALYAAMMAPQAKIYSAEPVPTTFQRLVNHLERNNLSSRVTALNCAVGGHAGARFIARENVPAGQKRLLTGDDQVPVEAQVQCRTIESILDQYNLEHVDLAKIDIEGSEYEALLSTPPQTLRRIARIDLEVHNNLTAREYSLDNLVQHLAAGAFALTRLETNPHGFSQARFACVQSGSPRS